MLTCLRGLFLLLVLLAVAPGAQSATLLLSVADIEAASFSARGLRLALQEGGEADLTLDELRIQDQTWRKVAVHCGEFGFDGATVRCRRGQMSGDAAVALEFDYELPHKRLDLALTAGAEHWQVTGEFGLPNWQVELRLHQAQVRRLAGFLPAQLPLPSQGTLDGRIAAHGNASGLGALDADLHVTQLAFSDASGLHAAEGLAGRLQVAALNAGGRWDWKTDLQWQDGELFWQPLYLRGGHGLRAAGKLRRGQLEVTHATARLAQVGDFELAGRWDSQAGALLDADLQGRQIALAPLFATWIQPWLDKSALAHAELSGHADVDWRYRSGATTALTLKLHDAAIVDAEHRFGLRGIEASIPWQASAETQASIRWASGELLKLPLGATELSATLRGLELTLPVATVPILDGQLSLRDFHLHRESEAWHWSFAGSLAPIAMQALSSALGLPEMHGTLSGMIPQVSYADGEMTVDGALLFRLFDGTIVANRLRLYDAFGRAPRLSGNLDMRGLDLDLLTRTFSFGNIQGKLDVSVNNLELANWQPVRFDAKVASSPGRYRKKISQKAVENISSLGGSGATAALQRSFLRVFENFGYSQIGLSCVLRDGVCLMDGVSGSKDGYVIVQGGGIPAITVMGYNRAVGWDELLARLKRVMQDNVKAVVK
ncbi:hypothetical protein [Ferriphaselus sp. R-1]|uniref:hypothetical protein n=1 Tax=Ferriphaselus sp. R-1 TaxID=1485544 RepID=UPI000555F249|nr:hypothetical protein [Ferriphaselus sp. R-1]